MRVIAGLCRGRRLKSVKGWNTRPTADRVKEAVFNVLGNRTIDASFLDLFAGTGNMGIEAISRGCSLAVFVEKDRKAVQVIKDNLLNCNIMDRALIFHLDCIKALKIIKKENIKFNLVYLDPPYKMEIIKEVLEYLVDLQLLHEDAIVMAETSVETQLTPVCKNLHMVKESKYGDIKITYYQLKGEV